MPKKIAPMTPVALNRKIAALTRAGKRATIAVGGAGGLLLQVTPTGATTWVLRYHAGVKPGTRDTAWRRDLGLGSYPDVSLAAARERAKVEHEKIANGIDPITARREKRSAMVAARLAEITFTEAADQCITMRAAGWKDNGKSEAQWRATLNTYAGPVIGSLRVADIGLTHVLQVLEPIWTEKTVTATRVRQRMETVLDWATVRGYRKGDNPARWRGALDKVLPPPAKVHKVVHMAALSIESMPKFMERLHRKHAMGAQALRFAILTAARSGEVRGATWDEIDLAARVWTIPGERMKAGKQHRVPLSDDTVKLLEALPRFEGTPLVFPSARGRELSDMTLTKVLKDMKVSATAHGYRSTFRDWCAERTNFPRDAAEMALAHTIRSAVEAAYRRGDMLEKRRSLMEAWASFCAGKSAN